MARLLRTVIGRSKFQNYFQRTFSIDSVPLSYSEEVLQAKKENKPIVALESTIITHGMPYPKNLETAKQVENIIRENGAVPATVAILKGQLTVGLSSHQLESLAQGRDVVKASRRDLAPILADKLDGATTVAGTIIAADLADIPVFVTGGVGGVHREGATTMDVSADLNELGRSNTLVVCSGVKSILDIGRTLEYLETQGVCVCSFGDTYDFPAFYTVRSGYRAPYRASDAGHAARMLHAARTLQLTSGILVAVPVPEQYAMDEKVIEKAIKKSLEDAKKAGIHGKEITPFILAAVAKATGGASLEANIALIKNNAKVGAEIAVEFKKLRNADNLRNASNIGFAKGVGKFSLKSSRQFHSSARVGSVSGGQGDWPMFGDQSEGDVVVIGGANVDRTYRVMEGQLQLDGSTHACGSHSCAGGVARNMAEALWRLRGGRVRLLTAVGDDADGRYLASVAPGLIVDGCIVKGQKTATYAAVLDSRGECRIGLGDMAAHNHITVDLLKNNIGMLEKAPLVILDGNAPQDTIDYAISTCRQLNKPLFFEPTDRRKAVKALHSRQPITCSSPNLIELQAMAKCIQPDMIINGGTNVNEILRMCKIVCEFIDILIITLSAKGVMVVRHNLRHNGSVKNDTCELKANLYPVEVLNNIENVSGAGDCFASGFLHGVLQDLDEPFCVSMGFESAKAALLSKKTVPEQINISKPINRASYETLYCY